MATIHEISSEWQIEGLSPTWVKVHKAVVEYDLAQSRIRALEAERDALAADAARYRWLVAQMMCPDENHQEEMFNRLHAINPDPANAAEVDAAIDAAMKGE